MIIMRYKGKKKAIGAPISNQSQRFLNLTKPMVNSISQSSAKHELAIKLRLDSY